jgi:hypothetical protein
LELFIEISDTIFLCWGLGFNGNNSKRVEENFPFAFAEVASFTAI